MLNTKEVSTEAFCNNSHACTHIVMSGIYHSFTYLMRKKIPWFWFTQRGKKSKDVIVTKWAALHKIGPIPDPIKSSSPSLKIVCTVAISPYTPSPFPLLFYIFSLAAALYSSLIFGLSSPQFGLYKGKRMLFARKNFPTGFDYLRFQK